MAKTALKKKPAKKEVVNKKISKKGKKMSELELPSEPVKAAATEIISGLRQQCEDNGAAGFIFAVIDANGAVVPFVGGRNLGEVLLMETIVKKEVDRIVSSSLGKKEV